MENSSDIFPKYIIGTNFEKCVRAVKALHNMTGDNYEKDELVSFYEWTLYQTILWWNNVDNYLNFMFQDWDFLSVEEIYSIYRKNLKY